MATFAIGDVQGCCNELQLLVDALNFDPASDQLWFVGDLVNRGPDSLESLRFIRHLGSSAVCVLGNHEQRFLATRKADKPGRLKRREQVTYDSLTKADWKWMNAWPHVIEIPEQQILVVHGGFAPEVRWMDQDPDMVTRIQVLSGKNKPSRRAELPNGAPWADSWSGPQHVIYGHTPRPHALLHAKATGLDTGCVYGYALTAISLPDYQVYRIPALRPYFDD